MSLVRGIATVGAMTMASRVLGFVRDMLMAALLGAGGMADAFFVAFQFPNLFRRVFAEGAFNAAFVPLIADTLATDGRAGGRALAGQALSVMLAVLLPLTLAVEVAMPWLMAAFAPGFLNQPDKFALAVHFTRLCFPYLLFMALVSLLGGLLNAMERFAVAAAAPIVLNIVMIAALIGPARWIEPPGEALSWAVAAAGLAQFLWVAQAAHGAGVLPHLPPPRLYPQIRRLFALMGPGIFGASVVQVNLWLGTVLASLLPTGAISYLYYADRVNQLPLGVVGVAVGVALLPLLARQIKAGHLDAARANQNRAIELALLLTLPAAAALLAIPGPIVTVLFQRGAFGPDAARQTALTLAAFASGLPAYVLVKALAPGFFAREDTTTPVAVGVGAIAVNLLCAFVLMRHFAQVGIALGTSISSWLNALALGVILYRRGYLAPDRRLVSRIARIILATAAMAACLVILARAFQPWFFAAGTSMRAAALAALIGAGASIYVLACLVLGAAKPGEIRQALRRVAPAPEA